MYSFSIYIALGVRVKGKSLLIELVKAIFADYKSIAGNSLNYAIFCVNLVSCYLKSYSNTLPMPISWENLFIYLFLF